MTSGTLTSSRRSRFLTAEWCNLVMLNYAVDPAMLSPLVPSGTELDEFRGQAYVSLVGFEFNRTRVLGVAIPFHQDFLEVNLRFYVRYAKKRGVVFVRELVPKYAVATLARLIFSENYACARMSHRVERDEDGKVTIAEYAWGTGAKRCSMVVETEGEAFIPHDGTLSQFITEHYWGYSAQPAGSCLEYEVEHSPWAVWKAKSGGFLGDATAFYGAQFAEVLQRAPDSAFVAKGSPVTVFKGYRI